MQISRPLFRVFSLLAVAALCGAATAQARYKIQAIGPFQANRVVGGGGVMGFGFGYTYVF